MTNYTKGRRAEYLAIKALEDQGYRCIRSAGSHSIVDIVAFDAYEVKLIQVKKSKRKQPFHEARLELSLLPISPNVTKELWILNHGVWLKTKLT